MTPRGTVRAGPLLLGILAALAGAAFLWDVGALAGMAGRNLAAFVVGLLFGWAAHRLASHRYGAEGLFTAASAVLVLVLLSGIEMDGVARWLPLGPLTVQPALILSPLILAIAASREGRHWRVAILVPILLVALQPDAATMLALVAGTAAMVAFAAGRARIGWSARRIGIAAGAIGIALLGLLVAGIQTPPPVAFVEGTVGIASLSGPPAMLLHFAAIALMIAALLSQGGQAGFALAAYFATAAIMAMFFAFPMPLAGAGPSHAIGFGVAIGWLATNRRRGRQAT